MRVPEQLTLRAVETFLDFAVDDALLVLVDVAGLDRAERIDDVSAKIHARNRPNELDVPRGRLLRAALSHRRRGGEEHSGCDREHVQTDAFHRHDILPDK